MAKKQGSLPRVMAVSTQQLVAVAAVAAIVLGTAAYNAVRARMPSKGRKRAAPMPPPILNRFVVHEGAIVGEVVAVEGSRVLLRQGIVYKQVPLDQVQAQPGEEVRLMGTIDWMEAEMAGAEWAKRRAAAPHPTPEDEAPEP